ncbi:hypothetical protein FJZ33_06370 [Candidatus Poribacteria bacterium]|nr:hypothetical protein [Candidatus Poribacteria bacterium]
MTNQKGWLKKKFGKEAKIDPQKKEMKTQFLQQDIFILNMPQKPPLAKLVGAGLVVFDLFA